MRKILIIFLALIMLLSTAYANEHEWKNHYIENERGYVFMLPSTYHVIYKGMPENSSYFAATGLSYHQAELLLDLYEATVIFYNSDFSCYATITQGNSPDSIDYDLLSAEDFDYRMKCYEDEYDSILAGIGNYTINDLMVMPLDTDFAKYITVSSDISFESYSSYTIQLVTVKNGYQTIISFASEDAQALYDSLDALGVIIENLVIL